MAHSYLNEVPLVKRAVLPKEPVGDHPVRIELRANGGFDLPCTRGERQEQEAEGGRRKAGEERGTGSVTKKVMIRPVVYKIPM